MAVDLTRIFEYVDLHTDGIVLNGFSDFYQEALNILPRKSGLLAPTEVFPNGDGETLVIPDKIDGKPVTSIGDCAFASMFFSSIQLPATLRTIKSRAFANNRLLKTVKLGNAVARIDDRAFIGCSSLTEINLPDSLVSIGRKAFQYCGSLAEIRLPKRLALLEEKAFNSSGIRSLETPRTLSMIDSSTFAACKNLTTVKLAEGIVEIHENAFSRCSSLRSVRFSPSLIGIDERAFAECNSLEFLDLPKGLLQIGDAAFWGCENLRYALIPPSVENIGDGAFAGIKGILDVDPENPYYKSVGDMLLTKDGKKLLSFPGGVHYREIPEGVEEIANYAFFKFRRRPPLKYPKSLRRVEPEAYPN